MRVGFIGMGSQGAPMAQRIIAAGYATTLWARRAATLQPFERTDATVAGSPSELAVASDLVCVCVLNDADVEEVVIALMPGITQGSVIAVHSTVHPGTCTRLAAVVQERGATLIDAPVSGGAPAAAAGELLVMVGGDTDTFERCRPVFETYGSPVMHMGPLGTGQLAKLVNNALFVANIAMAEDALALGESFELERAALAAVIKRGSGSSYSLRVIANTGVQAFADAAGGLLRKDVDIVTDVARERGADARALMTVADDVLTRTGRPRSS
jgi:3-hydroxyisobutyrate dehydrogenase